MHKLIVVLATLCFNNRDVDNKEFSTFEKEKLYVEAVAG